MTDNTKKLIAREGLIILVLILLLGSSLANAGSSQVAQGDSVILIKPLSDGVTYLVQTPYGQETWKDRDLYHLALYGETCKVVKSYGTEILVYIPIMNKSYWFTVK